ncbi:hypothetical protein AAH678_06835 [Sodalis endosymbiont of Spalangia cameroni]|uniref:hypothetical protein n=1 Tax=Sodalis praecaptivus TaxID=1239307 RepID=UPI0031F80C2F
MNANFSQLADFSVVHKPYQEILKSGNGGGGDDMLGERVAKLESDVEYIKRDVSDLKTDVRQISNDVSAIKMDLTKALHMITEINGGIAEINGRMASKSDISAMASKGDITAATNKLLIWFMGYLAVLASIAKWLF